MSVAYINLAFFDFAWEWEWITFCFFICNNEAFLMWTINDFLFSGNYLGASLSSIHSCSTHKLCAKGTLANLWKESARPVLSGVLFNFTFHSFSVISTCSQKYVLSKREMDRQNERTISTWDDELRILISDWA